MRFVRIFISLPGLAQIKKKYRLELTVKELKDQKWLIMDLSTFYALQATSSPYEKHLDYIIKKSDKIRAFNGIRKGQAPGRLLIVATVWPVSALILY